MGVTHPDMIIQPRTKQVNRKTYRAPNNLHFPLFASGVCLSGFDEQNTQYAQEEQTGWGRPVRSLFFAQKMLPGLLLRVHLFCRFRIEILT